MKILTTEHKQLHYEFRFLERTLVVHVFKGGQFTYEAKWTGRSFVCNCPGARYHKKCWHLDMIPALLAQSSCTEPWCEWAEEAQEMEEEKYASLNSR